ncbi:MAG: hypothetical protein WC794_05810 [Candidatus Doudnabacteria bacterium]|jgi:hypothetical protein
MNQTPKIILLIFVATFLFNVPIVQAAVKYVPTQEQLQPMPVNVQPNLSGNVNYIDPSGEGKTVEENSESPRNQNSEPANIKPKAPQPSLIANIILLPAQNSTAGKTAWWLIVLGLAGAGTWLLKKKYDKK